MTASAVASSPKSWTVVESHREGRVYTIGADFEFKLRSARYSNARVARRRARRHTMEDFCLPRITRSRAPFSELSLRLAVDPQAVCLSNKRSKTKREQRRRIESKRSQCVARIERLSLKKGPMKTSSHDPSATAYGRAQGSHEEKKC